jgi:ribose-phosphate pyrophosphokinase
MTKLNLDRNFQPYGQGIEFQEFIFPSDCEVHIKLPTIEETKVLITTRIKSSDDVMKLLLAHDALKHCGVKEIKLLLPYLPYARQDRQMIKGEPLSLKVFAELLNSLNLEKVSVYDVHSDVSLALINNIEVISNHAFVSEVLKEDDGYYIVSPDAGAYKKIFKLCQYLRYRDEIIICNKLRDVSNGVIRSVTVSHDDLKGKNCYIIDDVCDGGNTFIQLAYELKRRNAGKVYLIVSHGIFSKGVDALENINHIYTTNAFNDQQPNKKLTQIKLNPQLL